MLLHFNLILYYVYDYYVLYIWTAIDLKFAFALNLRESNLLHLQKMKI